MLWRNEGGEFWRPVVQKWLQACVFLNQALAARPQSPTVALSLAMAAKQTGRTEETANLARQLRGAAGPGNPEIEQVLSEIERS